MSYIDALYKKDEDKIYVVERDPKKGRVFVEYDARYVFYYRGRKGQTQKSMTGEPLQRVSVRHKRIHKRATDKIQQTLFMNMISILCLGVWKRIILGKETPKLNVMFFDIEVDFDPDRGYSTTDDPFMPITAISCYMSWTDQLVTFAVPPKTISMDDRRKELTKRFDNTMLFEKEKDMLDAFLELVARRRHTVGLEQSEGYDIPYTVGRIQKVLSSDDTRRLCFWGQKPKKREFREVWSENS